MAGLGVPPMGTRPPGGGQPEQTITWNPVVRNSLQQPGNINRPSGAMDDSRALQGISWPESAAMRYPLSDQRGEAVGAYERGGEPQWVPIDGTTGIMLTNDEASSHLPWSERAPAEQAVGELAGGASQSDIQGPPQLFTANGTPIQEGVFEHHPANLNPSKPSKMQKTENGSSKTRHSRSRTGCYTCRSRRVKCDETQPECLACRKSHRTCSYTDNRLPSTPTTLSSASIGGLATD